jgi:hypothetical protein
MLLMQNKLFTFQLQSFKLKSLYYKLNRKNPGICRDFRQWCESSQDKQSCVILSPQEDCLRSLPFTIEQEIASSFLEDQICLLQERFVARIPNAKIVGQQGFIILPDKRFAYDYQTHHEPFIRENPLYFQRWSPHLSQARWSGSYFSVVGVFCHTYYHWMHDVLLQFYQVLEYLPNTVKIIVPSALTSLQRQTLQMVGLSEERLVYLKPNSCITLDELYFIPPPTITGFDSPDATTWFHHLAAKSLSLKTLSSVNPQERIYISRKFAKSRRVTNEAEVLKVLTTFNFKAYTLEDLCLEEQAKLFYCAEFIVAPHGAGLVNLLFSRSGIKVLELFFEPVDRRTHFWSLAEARQIDYYYITGQAVANGDYEPDMYIPLSKIQEIIKVWQL